MTQAEKMHELRATGLSYVKIAEQLGSNREAVMKELVPGYRTRANAHSLKWKHTHRKKCVDCGKPIRHDATRCQGCRGASLQKWTRETVIDAIQRFHAENGRPPTSGEWDAANPEKGYPAKSRVYGGRLFKTWNEAIAASGFTPTPVGRHKRG